MKIVFGGHQLVLHPSGALFWPARGLMVVADLHLEKGSHYARRQYFLPPYDSRETLGRLLDVQEAAGNYRILVLGDGFHDNDGFSRLGPEERELFATLQQRDLLWVRGNHDRDLLPGSLAVSDFYEDSGLVFRHEATLDGFNEISAHFHPKVEMGRTGNFMSFRCFVADERKLILPAFGAYTGGLSANNPAIRAHFPQGFSLYALGRKQVYRLYPTGEPSHG